MQIALMTVATHEALGRAIDQVGGSRFWRQLIFCMQDILPFDNAVVAIYGQATAPEILEEFDSVEQNEPSPLTKYLEGLYLLDPFWQAMQEGIPTGVYQLKEVAPDHFRQSDYFAFYFQKSVGHDELQLILRISERATLSISFGSSMMFSVDHVGLLHVCQPWLLALMRRHWASCNGSSATENHRLEIGSRVEAALSEFGSEILSAREKEIARLILAGHSSKAIAEKLHISPETVKVHRRHLYNKLDVTSQPELFSRFLSALNDRTS